jgi:hypothetical protein
MKYPLMRLGHVPERLLRKKLYLDFTGRRERRPVPESVPVPEHRLRPAIPETEGGGLIAT